MTDKKKIHRDLPQILILKRTYIQRFPNGQQVALYHSEHLDQFVTVPLDGSQFSNTTESVLEKLTQISETDEIQSIIFSDLSELNINKECARNQKGKQKHTGTNCCCPTGIAPHPFE